MWAESSFERALFAGKMHYRLNLATGEAEHTKFFSELYTRPTLSAMRCVSSRIILWASLELEEIMIRYFRQNSKNTCTV